MLTRRDVLASPLALAALQAKPAAGRMTLGLHQNTSSGAGYRRSLEGWAKAGITNVELTAPLVDEFLKTETLAAAKRVLTDNGLTPVSAASGAAGIFEPNPNRAAALDTLKRRCEMFARAGADPHLPARHRHREVHGRRLQGGRREHARGRARSPASTS